MSLIAARLPHPLYCVLPELARRYGDVVNVPMPPFPGWSVPMTLVSHPDHVDHVMSRNHSRYLKHESVRQLVVDEPLSLPLLEGEEWKRTRLQVSPFFTEDALAAISPAMAASLTVRMDGWAEHARSGEWVNLEHELGTVVMDGLMQSMFTMTLETARLERYVDAIREYGFYVISRSATYVLPGYLPRPFKKRGQAAQAYINAELDDVIETRRAGSKRAGPDILDVLADMSFEGCPRMQYRRLRQELASLIFGFETTAEALAWTIALLCANPAALAKAYAEVDALGGEPIGYAELDQLEYLKASFDEAQRIQAAPLNARTAVEDDEIAGYFIPKGSNVLMSPHGLHRDPRFWKQPEKFEPARFLTDKINRNAFLPFSLGPRKCLGARMAYIQGVMTLAAILQRYAFEIRSGWKPQQQLRVSTGLVGGLPVRITQR